MLFLDIIRKFNGLSVKIAFRNDPIKFKSYVSQTDIFPVSLPNLRSPMECWIFVFPSKPSVLHGCLFLTLAPTTVYVNHTAIFTSPTKEALVYHSYSSWSVGQKKNKINKNKEFPICLIKKNKIAACDSLHSLKIFDDDMLRQCWRNC